MLKMNAEQLPHEIYTTVGSKKPRQKQMRRTETKRENLPVQIYCGGMPRTLVRFRSMQRPSSMQCSKVEGGSGASELERREEEEEARKGKKERTPEPIYKAKG